MECGADGDGGGGDVDGGDGGDDGDSDGDGGDGRCGDRGWVVVVCSVTLTEKATPALSRVSRVSLTAAQSGREGGDSEKYGGDSDEQERVSVVVMSRRCVEVVVVCRV